MCLIYTNLDLIVALFLSLTRPDLTRKTSTRAWPTPTNTGRPAHIPLSQHHCFVGLWTVTGLVEVASVRNWQFTCLICWFLVIMTTKSLSLSYRDGHIPTTEELSEALLNAAAAGNRSKLKKLLDTGRYSVMFCFVRNGKCCWTGDCRMLPIYCLYTCAAALPDSHSPDGATFSAAISKLL